MNASKYPKDKAEESVSEVKYITVEAVPERCDGDSPEGDEGGADNRTLSSMETESQAEAGDSGHGAETEQRY